GENAPTVRARICDGLGFLGIELETKRNAANERLISAAASRVTVRVIRTDEERMIAKTVCGVLDLGMAVIITQRKELHDESRRDEWLDGRRDVALDSDRGTGGGPARRL